MDFEKYWGYGDFTLHSGDKSTKLWNAKWLLKPENEPDLAMVVDYLKKFVDGAIIVGIRTMGAVLGNLVGNCVPFDPKIKRLEASLPRKAKYMILDDVLTRGTSVKEAMIAVGRKPKSIVVLVVRDDVNGGLEKVDGVKVVELRRLMKG